MPINRKYPLAALLAACRNYPLRPWEHLTFEYVMLGRRQRFSRGRPPRRSPPRQPKIRQGESDPVEPWRAPYRESSADDIELSAKSWSTAGIPAFVRYSRGPRRNGRLRPVALLNIAPANANTGRAATVKILPARRLFSFARIPITAIIRPLCALLLFDN